MSYFDNLNEFTDEEIANNGVSSANDALEGSAAENKKVFDKLPKYIAGRINIIISSLRNFASSIDEKIEESIPKKLSRLENDMGFITDESVPKMVSELENDMGFITDEAVPKKLSQLENDTDFATNEYVAGLVGDIDEALDGIISMQNELIAQGGDGDMELMEVGDA